MFFHIFSNIRCFRGSFYSGLCGKLDFEKRRRALVADIHLNVFSHESLLSQMIYFVTAKLMRILIKNAGPIIFGMVAGFLIACVAGPHKDFFSAGSVFRENPNLEDRTVADKLKREVKVLCWILTTSSHHQSKALHVKNTWGRRCNKLLFMSNVKGKLRKLSLFQLQPKMNDSSQI